MERLEAHLTAEDYYSVIANMRGSSKEEVSERLLRNPLLRGLQASAGGWGWVAGLLHLLIHWPKARLKLHCQRCSAPRFSYVTVYLKIKVAMVPPKLGVIPHLVPTAHDDSPTPALPHSGPQLLIMMTC